MKTLIRNVQIVSDNNIVKGDVLIDGERIHSLGNGISAEGVDEIFDGEGKFLLPGVIDCQVHFRDPGLTHKGDLISESRAAAAGGVTSFIDMPNTIPNTLTIDDLNNKYELASQKSLINFGFLMGINQQNWEQISNEDVKSMLALTDDGLYFSGKGNLLAQFPEILEKLFLKFPQTIIALHCEDEDLIEDNIQKEKAIYGEDIPFNMHGRIRSDEACYRASKRCIDLAKSTNGRFHLLHVTSGRETQLLESTIPLQEKRITAEVCVQNLLFCDEDYNRLGSRIKWNPSIKTSRDRDQLWEALLDGRIDFITTDHAPHTSEEKSGPYTQALSGAPMIQHALPVMLDFVNEGKLSIATLVEKMSHNPAIVYNIKDRGFIREGYYADLTLVDLNDPWVVAQDNIYYKCGWSPLEGNTMKSRVLRTWVNGSLVFNGGNWSTVIKSKPLVKDLRIDQNA